MSKRPKSFRLDDELCDRLSREAERLQRSEAWVVERALEAALRDDGNQAPGASPVESSPQASRRTDRPAAGTQSPVAAPPRAPVAPGRVQPSIADMRARRLVRTAAEIKPIPKRPA